MINLKKFPSNFCSVPWLQVHTEPDGKVYPCCYFDQKDYLGNWNEEKIVNIYKGTAWNKLRKDFLDNKKNSSCNRCWEEEDAGVVSMRQRFNERYSNFPDSTNKNNYNKLDDIFTSSNDDGSVDDLKLSTIDLIFNNLCNLKCRSCGTRYSTSWIQDEIKLGRSKFHPTKLLSNATVLHIEDDLSALINLIDPYTEIHFTGGEPMIQEDHYKFLQLLISKGKTKVKIRYNTNLTTHVVQGIDAFDLLKHFENVFLVGSIDAMGKQGEYIRKGFNWKDALNWFKTAKEKLPHADFGISAVYSLLNCYAAIDLHRYVCENDLFQYRSMNFGFYLNVLHEPTYLKTTLLPAEVKDELIKKINDHITWLKDTQATDFGLLVSLEHWESAIAFMKSKDQSDLLPIFFEETTILDNLRNEKFQEVFPEIFTKLRMYFKK